MEPPVPIPETTGAFAIVPHNDLSGALPFWERLGFARTGGDSAYMIMTGWGCEVHLTQAGSGLWRVPAEHNPFGVFIRTPDVDAIAARVDDLVIRPGGVLRHREWGLYEVGIAGPDGILVRIGWPSRLAKGDPAIR
ncbi:glyoxalase [Sphingomonas sp. AR_OL41]|uniref:glyoxalase n=1 Tax=Sphingomonas sp. AR_OL41 TaxID=3042729 RepID=UPI0024800D51|nr:glyoxalase [Sphingomonas sp. AR_OL41]MDH7973138.1 glyoxalase [Sphingomonas sp. AR_OL41]